MRVNNLKPEHQFTSTKQPTRHGPVKGTTYFKPLLKKALEGKIEFDDPITNKKGKAKIGRVIVLRHIMNAIQGEHLAIKDIMDRVDDVKEDSGGQHIHFHKYDFKDMKEEDLIDLLVGRQKE